MTPFRILVSTAIAASALSSTLLVHAQSPTTPDQPLSRAQVKIELSEFKRTHRYDTVKEVWVLRDEFETPAGTKSRIEIKNERDEFLRNNRWNTAQERWESLNGVPRDLDLLPRAKVKAERDAFLKTYRFDEQTSAWVRIKPS